MKANSVLLLLSLLQFMLILQSAIVNCQQQQEEDLAELENTPYLLKSGAKYRDLLTIGASQAVADFATRFRRQEESKINQSRLEAQRTGADRPLPAQFFSHTLSQPVGHPNLDFGIEFTLSRRIRIPPDLLEDRVLADRTEAVLLAERDADNKIPDPSTVTGFDGDFGGQFKPSGFASSQGLSRGRPKISSLPSSPSSSLFHPAYSTDVNYGLSYPAYTSYASTAAPPPPPPPPPPPSRHRLELPYSPVPAPPSASRAPYGRSLPGKPTVDYKFEISHGAGGGSYSYSNFS